VDRSYEWVETARATEYSPSNARIVRLFVAMAVSVILGTILTPPFALLNFGFNAVVRTRETQQRQEMTNKLRIEWLIGADLRPHPVAIGGNNPK
jgi:hypothetical protein